ncbi:MAG: hypothetical protein WHS87_06870 [Anaerolineales bacterium]
MKIVHLVLSFFLLALLACSLPILATTPSAPNQPSAPSGQTVATAPPTLAPTVTATNTPSAPAGECYNPYYPVLAGARWEYQMSGASSDTFTSSILDVRENGFEEQLAFRVGTVVRRSWECRQGDLISLTPSALASVSVPGMEMNFTVESNSGITLPADPKPGQEWTQNVVYAGTANAGGMNFEVRGELTLSCRAVGMERVSVQAGNFDALRVDCATKLDISLSGSAAFSLNENGSSWYAPGVGLVKSSGNSNAGPSELVLLSYSIP